MILGEGNDIVLRFALIIALLDQWSHIVIVLDMHVEGENFKEEEKPVKVALRTRGYPLASLWPVAKLSLTLGSKTRS